jgi:uncharacterized membrane protein YphA (DoxX/SURF4 family)
MNTFLWALQIILAVKLLTVTLNHGLQQGKPSMQEAAQKMGLPARTLLYLAAAGTFTGALGLILPGLLNAAAWITPLSAALMAVMLLVSIFFHVRSREQPKIFVSLILFAFAAFVAYGRWVLVPF